jgi:hypothetical protein
MVAAVRWAVRDRHEMDGRPSAGWRCEWGSTRERSCAGPSDGSSDANNLFYKDEEREGGEGRARKDISQ